MPRKARPLNPAQSDKALQSEISPDFSITFAKQKLTSRPYRALDLLN